MTEKGILYIVGTPIGNLEDMTLRAARILREVDLIAAEDTRHSLKLLNHLDIHKPLISYHEHNRAQMGEVLLNKLSEGQNIALVTDAGMPVISDPGYELVRDAHLRDIPVQVVPGPCAVSSALALSGMNGAQYLFMGFIPRSGLERKKALEMIHESQQTVILYEAPHRLQNTLKDLSEGQADRMISVCHDLTKLYESVAYVTLEEACRIYQENEPKGEFVLVLEGAVPGNTSDPENAEEELVALLAQGMSSKDAAKAVSQKTGISKNDLYKLALQLVKDSDDEN